MKESLLKSWIAALRGGDYHQGQSRLMKSKGGDRNYCCLGVLCDLIEPEGWEWNEENDEYRFVVDHDSSYELLPLPIAEDVGLTASGAFSVAVKEVTVDGHSYMTSKQPDTYTWDQWDDAPMYDSLVEMNDDGTSFDQIADLLDTEYQLVFA